MSARNFYIMQSAVGPMQSELPCYTPLTNHATDVHTVPMVFASDYERLEQECAHVREERDSFQRVGIRTMEERDTALQLLAQCQEHLHPHRDAVLWGQVVETLRGKPC